MRWHGGLGLKLRVAALAVVAAVLSATPSPAGDFPGGWTWFSDGTFFKSGPPGSTVSVYVPNALPGRKYVLGSTPEDPWGGPCDPTGFQPLNPSVRTATTGLGFIGLTTGVLNRPPGRYHICFFPADPADSSTPPTEPAYFDVTA